MEIKNIILSLSAIAALGLTGCGSDSTNSTNHTLTRLATVHSGAEVTGIEVTKKGELFFNSQHPGKADEYSEGKMPATIGYVKGMDINKASTTNVAIPEESNRDRIHVSEGEYITLAKAGDKINNNTEILGGVYDVKGNLLYVSNDVDVNSFVEIDDNNAYLYTGWEGAQVKGASSLSRLKLEKVDGQWTTDMTKSKMIDLSSIKGGWILCFGHNTPWETSLVAEEYYYLNTSLWNYPGHHDGDNKPYYVDGSTNITYHVPGTMTEYLGLTGSNIANPYYYGYQIEIKDRKKDTPTLIKHYAMGRFSHENGVVMSDNKTVYQSDDDSAKYGVKLATNSGGVLFKFIADKENDLSSGTLYAAKLVQSEEKDASKATFDVEWIELGHSNNSEVEKWIKEYDSVTTDDYIEGKSSYISDDDVNNWAEGKLNKDLDKDGTIESFKDDSPAFLESRKAAYALGATAEWNKMEGVTADKENLYIAVSDIGYTMSNTWGDLNPLKGGKEEAGGDISLEDEHCGAVYQAKIEQDYNIKKIVPLVLGETKDDACNENKIANPDNILSFDNGKLLIGEDSGNHGVDMLWLLNKN